MAVEVVNNAGREELRMNIASGPRAGIWVVEMVPGADTWPVDPAAPGPQWRVTRFVEQDYGMRWDCLGQWELPAGEAVGGDELLGWLEHLLGRRAALAVVRKLSGGTVPTRVKTERKLQKLVKRSLDEGLFGVEKTTINAVDLLAYLRRADVDDVPDELRLVLKEVVRRHIELFPDQA
jgi:hypothetical protein